MKDLGRIFFARFHCVGYSAILLSRVILATLKFLNPHVNKWYSVANSVLYQTKEISEKLYPLKCFKPLWICPFGKRQRLSSRGLWLLDPPKIILVLSLNKSQLHNSQLNIFMLQMVNEIISITVTGNICVGYQ